MTANDVLTFWFNELKPKQWFIKNAALDRLIADRFRTTLELGAGGGLKSWRATPHGRLAEILVLDQFSRNVYRDSALSFAQDPLALSLAREAVAAKADQQLKPEEKAFVYMPFMHSESPEAHADAMILFNQPGLEDNFDFEKKHKAIIDRFGRYPHRNAILNRKSTPEEIEFLKSPGSSF